MDLGGAPLPPIGQNFVQIFQDFVQFFRDFFQFLHVGPPTKKILDPSLPMTCSSISGREYWYLHWYCYCYYLSNQLIK